MAKIFGISDLPVSTIDKTESVGGDVFIPKPYEMETLHKNFTKDSFNPSYATKRGKSFLSLVRKGFSKLLSRPLKALRK